MTLFPTTCFAASQSEKFFETVCDGCGTFPECNFDVGGNETPNCVEQIEHATSAGGNHTLEMLSIDAGYWRATETSTDVRACYNAKACCGGMTGISSYCQDGYEGPCES